MAEIIELRKYVRRQVRELGRIMLKPPGGTLDVVVWDVGDGGVKFEIDETTDLPKNFDLVMVAGGTITPVEIRWRRGNFVGVQFCGESKTIDFLGA